MSKRKTTPELPSMDELLSGQQPSAPPEPVTEEDKEEAKQQREKERGKRRAKYQARYDLPPGMKDKVADVANELETTASQVAAYLIADGLRRLESGKLDIKEDRTLSRSPRNKYNLKIENYID